MQRNLGTQHAANGSTNGVNGHGNGHVEPRTLELDAVIVGAGFAGIYLMHKLRQEGFNVKIVEAGHGLGGIWYWNSYPGARVDSPYPVYALAIPEVYNTWTWSEEYPGEKELKKYFQHIDKVLDISKDVLYGTKVVGADFDESTDKWKIRCENGTRITARFFHCCIGFAAKRLFPDWPGLEDRFKGYLCHSSFWPAGGVDVKGKKVAVVGTGATGVQIAQETAREADHLTCFVRTPNIAFPMRQKPIDPKQSQEDAKTLQEVLRARSEADGGFAFTLPTCGVFDHTPEQREETLEEAWRLGGFRFLFAYTDILTSQEANDEMYRFWVKKRRAEMQDPAKRDLLAPAVAPHPVGGKRPSLEQDYYRQMDRPHVTLVDVRANPVSHVVENGIVTADGVCHEADVLAIATGFDSVTGGYRDLDITGLNGIKLADKWRHGTFTYLGMSVAQFPNFLFTYGPQSPTAYANGPSIVEPQADWIVDVMKKMRAQGTTRINAHEADELEWKKTVSSIHAATLRDKVEGWYMGTNVPGKPREALNYAGGIPLYLKTLRGAIEPEWKGFTVT